MNDRRRMQEKIDFLHMTKEERAYASGQWDAYARIMNYLNTLDDNVIDKAEIYKHLIAMRPEIPHELYDRLTTEFKSG
jgi:hypothetical protein